MRGFEELAERAHRGPVSVKLVYRKSILVVGAPEVRKLSQQLIYDFGVHRLVNLWGDTYIAAIEADLPLIRRRNHHIAAYQLAPLHVVAECRRQQTDTIAALAINLISLLEYGNSCPLQISGLENNVLFFRNHFQPIVQPASHNRADWAHPGYVQACLLSSRETTLYGFGHCNALRQRKRDRRIDADAAVGGLFDGSNACMGRRDLH